MVFRVLRVRDRPCGFKALGVCFLSLGVVVAYVADPELVAHLGRLARRPTLGVDALKERVQKAPLHVDAFFRVERQVVAAGDEAQIFVLRARVHEALDVASEM